MYTFVQLLSLALAASSSVDAFQLGNNVGLARRATGLASLAYAGHAWAVPMGTKVVVRDEDPTPTRPRSEGETIHSEADKKRDSTADGDDVAADDDADDADDDADANADDADDDADADADDADADADDADDDADADADDADADADDADDDADADADDADADADDADDDADCDKDTAAA